jgi:hypothetical protein
MKQCMSRKPRLFVPQSASGRGLFTLQRGARHL